VDSVTGFKFLYNSQEKFLAHKNEREIIHGGKLENTRRGKTLQNHSSLYLTEASTISFAYVRFTYFTMGCCTPRDCFTCSPHPPTVSDGCMCGKMGLSKSYQYSLISFKFSHSFSRPSLSGCGYLYGGKCGCSNIGFYW
jgi:hypothetical protein